MIKDKSYRIILLAAMIVGLMFLGIAMSAEERVAPKSAVKLDTTLKSDIKLTPAVESKLLSISQDLVHKNLSAELARGISSRAETRVIRQTAKGYLAETIVLTLLKDTYTAEMSRIEFTHEGDKTTVGKVEKIYQPRVTVAPKVVPQDLKLEGEKQKLNVFKAPSVAQHPDKFEFAPAIRAAEEAERREGPHSWWKARGLSNTAASNFPSAVDAANQIHAIFNLRFGGSAAKRIGAASTWKEITDFMKYDNYLLAWSNIGHGVTDGTGTPCYGLVQWDKTIWHNEFATLSPYIGIYWCVAFTNSCNSFKDPLNAAIWSRKPRTYIGGNINLPVAKSEYTDRNFWYYTLLLKWDMAKALSQAQADKGFPPGTFGLKGYSGVF